MLLVQQQPHTSKRPLSRSGVTLIELILYVALVSVVVGMISSVMFGVFSNYQRERQAQSVEQQGLHTLQLVRFLVRNAEGIDNLSPGESGSTLQISVSDNKKNPTIIELNGTTLQLTEGRNDPLVLTNRTVEAVDLSFSNLSTNLNHDTIRIRFTLRAPKRADTTGVPYQQEFIGSAHVRNNYD